MYTKRIVTDLTNMAAGAGNGTANTVAPPPFFMYCAYQAVHGPLEAPADAVAKFSYITDKKRPVGNPP